MDNTRVAAHCKVCFDRVWCWAPAAVPRSPCSMGNLDTHVPRLLGGTSKLYTTRCISKELRGLGDEFRATAAAARGFLLHKCDHATPVAAAQCIKEQIGAEGQQGRAAGGRRTALPSCSCKAPYD